MPLTSTTITNFRNYARKLGSDFGQLDWRYFLIQMLYLVEYADYDSQEVLGLGNTNNTEIIKMGECNHLGMKSGTLNNDGKHSVIYRGIEDIFGNVWQYIDGINVEEHQVFLNYNPSTYQVDKFDGDYQKLGYVNALNNGYELQLGYDRNHSLVAFSISTSNNETSSISDYYWQSSGNRTAILGAAYVNKNNAGMWSFAFGDTSTHAGHSVGSRLLRYD